MNAAIFKRIELPNGEGAVTLYDWMAAEVSDGRNLIRTDAAGVEMWRAKPVFFDEPSHEDSFVAVEWDGTTLTAQTWSCFRVSVDLADGNVTAIEFTK